MAKDTFRKQFSRRHARKGARMKKANHGKRPTCGAVNRSK